ncbi:MAG TPA: hypothetical protein VFP16_13635, partial [Vicinamibacterales bacterium]|nr:hypothetical protein [Vicinamibacterales bacterium]
RRSTGTSARPQAAARRTAADGPVKAIRRVEREFNVLDNLDLSQKVSDDDFDKESAEKQARLSMLQRRAIKRGVSTILVFEGWDAAGKGGAIRRVTASLDARDYQVIPIAAPTDEERAHHYMWRFWRHLSRKGRLTIFDRSWYGRVLVERVERFATDAEYMRAYGEINHFEEQLVNHGILVLKFWIHISKAEQLRRFNDRRRTIYKRWKITDEDWRNRKRWEDYTVAVNDMVERTSTKIAPWTLVEGNDKNFARIKVLGTLAAALDHRLNR